MKWPRPAGEPDPRPTRREAEDAEETPSWLSSSDLASSPRPWERDDLAGLVESVATGEREIVAPAVTGSVDTPMYQQLRSERTEAGEPTRPTSDPITAPPGGVPAADDVRSEAPAPPVSHGVASIVADPLAEPMDGPTPHDLSPETERSEMVPGTGREVTSASRDDANLSATPARAPMTHGSGHGTHEDAPYEAATPAEGRDNGGPENVAQEGSSAATLGAVEAPAVQDGVTPRSTEPDVEPPSPDPAPAFHVEHEHDEQPVDEPVSEDAAETEDVAVAPEAPRAVGPRSLSEVMGQPDPTRPLVASEDHDARSSSSVGDPAAAAVAAQAAETLIGDTSGPEDEDPLLDVPTVPAAGASAATEALSGLEPDTRHATVICVANQKGGVGKTTTTVSLGAALAQEGAQVLVVDLDPQGNATTGLGLRAQEGAPSTYRVIVEQMDVEDASEPTAVKGLHVLPSSLDLAGAEIELVPAFSREMRLKNALDAVRDLYDVILIDCPPSLGLLTINAFVAADQVLVPIQCEYYALEGLGQLMRTVKLVSDSLNKDLVLGGVVLTMFDGRTNLSQQVVDEVRNYFGETAYQTIVPRTVRLSEAPSYGQPIGVFDPSSRGARSYQRLAREVARRLGVTLESQDVSPLDRLLGTVGAGGPTGTGMAQDDEVGRDGALPTDLDEDLQDLTETMPSSATAPGPDHGERPWSQTAGGSATGTEGER